MRKRILGILVVLLLLAVPLGSVYAYEALIGFTGVLQWDEANAYNGYTLFTAMEETKSYLIDMEGWIVHDWQADTRPGLMDKLLENGNLLRGSRPTEDYNGDPVGSGVAIGGQGGGVQEFTWGGKLIWEYINKTDVSVQHHTFYRMPSENTLILLWEKIECVDAVAAGRDPATCVDADGLWPDSIEEVDHTLLPGRPAVVWQWRVWDHIVQDTNAGLPTFGDPAANPDKLDLNFWVKVPWGFKDWNHGNTVEYNANTDQMIFNSRNWGEFYVIDKASVGIIFRWGNPGAYDSVTYELPSFNDDGDQELFGAHSVVFLGSHDPTNAGTPGNILIFDNGWNRPQGNRSRAVELEPNYADWEASPRVWNWQSRDANSFYTAFQGGTQRLPNGNTFNTSTEGGHLIEVTAAGDVVWEFVLPSGDGEGNRLPFTNDRVTRTIHRAHRYGPEYPGLAGQSSYLERSRATLTHIRGVSTPIWAGWDDPDVVADYTEPDALTGWGFEVIGIGGGGGAGGAGGGGAGGY
jgi:hypothetical protein